MLRKAPTWKESLDEIKLKRLSIPCVVGIYPREKMLTQLLEVDLTLYLDTREAAKHDCLTKSVDYAALGAEIRFLLQSAHFRLLETAAEAISHYILSPAPSDKPRGCVVGVEVLLRKPEALNGPCVPSLKIRRHRSEIMGHYEDFDFGEVYVIHRSHDYVFYRMSVKGLKTTPYYEHSYEDTSLGVVCEMPLKEGLVMAGQKMRAGVGLSFPEGFVRRYHNSASEDRSLLCVARNGTKFSVEQKGDVQMNFENLPKSMQKTYYNQEESSEFYY